jgi:catechol 2,3-dioxygenase-like lactoylglutathione lyase family enzyme
VEARVSLLTLGVEDLRRSREFYSDGLGWPLSSVSNDEVAFFGMAFFGMQGVVLALFPRELLAADAGVGPDGAGFRGFALAHNVAERASVDAVLAEAGAAGAVIVKPAEEDVFFGRSGYFADPDGHL